MLKEESPSRQAREGCAGCPHGREEQEDFQIEVVEATLVMAHGGQEQEQKDQHQHPYCHPRVLDKQVPQIIHPTPLLEHQGHAKA